MGILVPAGPMVYSLPVFDEIGADMSPKRAVVLLSGGLDSTTVLGHALAEGWEAYALTFDYGQRHREELRRAAEIARMLGAREHRTVRVDIAALGESALTADIAVPKDRAELENGAATDIPVTYVPARNTVFLSLALAWAETLGAADLFVGVNALDYSGYPDCRGEYLEAFERLANLATKAGVSGTSFRIHAPLLTLTKGGIVKRAMELEIDLSRTLSCYDPSPCGVPCGHCDACRLRAKGFAEAGAADPALEARAR
jgi:7-cyano-7-deazaguanine synthase